MTVNHLEVLVEELSAERSLTTLLPYIAPGTAVAIRSFRGKPDLLKKLPGRLAGYASYAAGSGVGVVVLADRDDDDCLELKDRLEKLARAAGLTTLTTASEGRPAVLANRIAIEELEAWLLGDVNALVSAFPGVPRSLGEKAGFRDPDAVAGGTAEALERVLQRHGYHLAGLNKVDAAAQIAPYMDVEGNRSASFNTFRDGIRRLVRGID